MRIATFAAPLLVSIVVAGCERKDRRATIQGPDAAAVATGATAPTTDAGAAEVPREKVEIPEVRIRMDGTTTVHVGWSAPAGTGVNEDAPFRVRWNRSDGLVDAPNDVKTTGSSVRDGFQVSVRPMTGAPNATLTGEIDLVVCDVETHSICVPVRRSLELGFIVLKDAAPDAKITIPLPQARVL